MCSKRKYLVFTVMLMFTISFVALSCRKEFEKINTNPYQPTDTMLNYNNLKVGVFFPQLAKAVITIGTPAEDTGPVNNYQIAIDLGVNNWAGYTAARSEKFNGGNNLTTYFFNDGWVNGTYNRRTADIFNPWLSIKQATGTSAPHLFAIAQIMKIAAYHQSTDMFGPMPYKNVGSGSFTVAYDSQQEIYNSFFAELTEAINVLRPFAAGDPLIPQYDVVYEGNVKKWIQFANSLMLRLAIRLSYADPAMARKFAEQAVADPGGLITDVADAAKMRAGAGESFMNPLETLWKGYKDSRAGASIAVYLKGYKDPRLPKYIQATTINGVQDYYGVRTGVAITSPEYEQFSSPNVLSETPLYWLMASEVSFLRAEGALRGWSMGGTADRFYNEGIQKSFQENAVNNSAYAEDAVSNPASYIDPLSAGRNAPSPTTVTIKWDNADGFERKLERIITQKWIALFPNGPEAWAEYRRTGYPKLIPITLNRSAGVISSATGVKRMVYPLAEYTLNGNNVRAAVQSLLGQPDNGASKVWWDKKP